MEQISDIVELFRMIGGGKLTVRWVDGKVEEYCPGDKIPIPTLMALEERIRDRSAKITLKPSEGECG